MKARIAILTLVLLSGLATAMFGSLALAAVSSMPLFVSTSATPNIMLVFDNSGSMNNIIWDPGYDPNVTYPNWADYSCSHSFGSGNPCWTAADGSILIGQLTDGDRDSCNSGRIRGRNNSGITRCLRLPDPVGSGNTRYVGNYLNYLFETYANVTNNDGRDLTTGLISTDYRIQVARNVATTFVNSNSNLRIGLSSFNPASGATGGNAFNNQGGKIDAVCGTATSTLVSTINGYGAVANTPLGETFYEVTRYFRGMSGIFHSNASHLSPIQYRCQRNFAIVITDGFPTRDNSIPTTDSDDTSGWLPNWDRTTGTPATTASMYPLFPQFSDGFFVSSGTEAEEGYTLYLDDLAKFAFDTDMRKSGNDLAGGSFNDAAFEIQRLRTYTVGFALENQMLKDAAFYGDGRFFNANNSAELNSALRSAISDIQTRTSAAASVATNSTRLSTDTLVYQARFSTNDWSGQLLAFPITASGGTGTPAWDAKNLIPTHGSRNIITWAGNTGVAFQYNNLNTSQKNALKLKPDNISGNDAYGTAVVNYLRGDTTNEAPGGQDFRARTSALGDIVNSDPVFVGKQDYGFDVLPGAEGGSYSSFRISSQHQSRAPMLYVGANDGMLHGFNASSGIELFAYVPNAIIPDLRFLTEASKADDPSNVGLPASGYNQKHRYLVDGSARAIDAYLDLSGTTTWHTILVGALGAGGKAVFAINVTDPANLGTGSPLWEFTTSSTGGAEMGYSIPIPSMGRMNNGSWVAIISNGYESSSNTARLYILNLATGAVIKEFNTGVGSSSQPNGLSSAIPVDVDRDRIIDFIYAGDMHGNLWKFDVTSSSSAQWDFGFKQGSTPKPLFTACTNPSSAIDCYNTRQPITSRPEVGSNPTGGQFVYFGTGKYFEDCDSRTATNSTTVNCSTTGTATQVIESFYGLRDLYTKGSTDTATPIGAGRSSTSLLQQSVIATQTFSFTNTDDSTGTEQVRVTSNSSITDTHQGWYIDLPENGERQVSTPLLRGGRIIFTTLIPNNDPCGFGGTSWLMELDALQGSRLSYSPFDLNNDQLFTIGDFVNITLADGSVAKVPVSGRKSKEGIIKTPGVITAGEIEYKFASGTTGGIDRTVENAANAGGRQSWRQLR